MRDTYENDYGTLCVSHATFDPDPCESRKMCLGLNVGQSKGVKSSKIAALALVGVAIPYMAIAADEVCIDYYTVGESKCQPAASTALAPSSVGASAQLVDPPSAQNQKNAVDDYLENYGKPPREFVEFYLNPTQENAQKWVTTYQGILQRGQDLSQAWGEAEQLYKTSNTAPSMAPRQVIQPVPQQVAPVKAPATPPVPASVGFGGLSSGGAGGQNSLGGVRSAPVGLTYYFSQTCPYCARLTPELSMLSKELGGKLEFTCVDVTPLGASTRPDEAFITSKLPCRWRLPEVGEVEVVGVKQTPTMVIQKEGKAQVKLSGYVPLAQLRGYFQ